MTSGNQSGFHVFSSKKAGFGQTYPVALRGHFFTAIKLLLGFRNYYDELQQCLGNFLIIVIIPFLHFGQQVISVPVNRSIISRIVSVTFSGKFASGSINLLRILIACFCATKIRSTGFSKTLWAEHGEGSV